MRRALVAIVVLAGCNQSSQMMMMTPPTPVTLTIALPQAVDGAMWVNPAVYTEVPLKVAVTGPAAEVRVELNGVRVPATDDNLDGTWIAMLPVTDLADGFATIDVQAEAPNAMPVAATAALGVGREGVQLTQFGIEGAARSPRLHRINGGLWVTWTDRAQPRAKAYLRRIDGAGRWMGERIVLVETDDEVHFARCAIGDHSIGVLYQRSGTPYKNVFKIVSFEGAELMAPIALDPPGWDATFGGDITFEAGAFTAVWRSQGAGPTQLGWLRVEEQSMKVTGPVILAKAGAGTAAEPAGGFIPFEFVKVQAIGDVSLVGFVRERHLPVLDLAIPKSELALVNKDGTFSLLMPGDPTDFTFHRESRVYKVGNEFAALWTAKDLNDPADNPAQVFYGARTKADAVSPPMIGDTVLSALDDRDEPFLMPHPEHFGVLAWLDHRLYAGDLQRGRILLYVAPVDEFYHAGLSTVFPHARFVAGLSDVNLTPAGSNALMMWIDERHGGGIANPRPEVYFETAWY